MSNITIDLGSGFGSGHGNTSCRIDLYWPSARLGVECDGVQHGEGRQRDWDAQREIRLANKGITELRISSRAFDSFNAASEFGEVLRRKLGVSTPFDDHGHRQFCEEELRSLQDWQTRSRQYWKSVHDSPWRHVPMSTARAYTGEGCAYPEQ